jgi:hypothetical protein
MQAFPSGKLRAAAHPEQSIKNMSPVESSSELSARVRFAAGSKVAGSVLAFAGLFLFAAQRWEISAASMGLFTLGVVVLWITGWRRGTIRQKRLLVRILAHVTVTIATGEVVCAGVALVGLMLTGDNPVHGSWGMKAVEWMDHRLWMIYGTLGVVTNFTTWVLFRFFSGENKARPTDQHNQRSPL